MRTQQRLISLGIHPVWSESSLSACRRSLGSLATHWTQSEDAQADLSLRWAHMSFCWFCHAAAQMKMLQSFTTVFYSFLQIADLQQEHQREMEGLLENVRQLSRELKLQMLIIDNFIPPEYQVLLDINCFICKSLSAGSGSSVGCASNWYSGDCGFNPPVRQHSFMEIGLVMKSFLWPFSPYCWFK